MKVISKESSFKIRSFESLDNAGVDDMTFLNSSKYQDLIFKNKSFGLYYIFKSFKISSQKMY